MSARRSVVVLMLLAAALAACTRKAPRSQSGSRTPTTPAAGATSPTGFPANGLVPPRPSSSVTCAIVTVNEVNAALGTALSARHVDSSNPPATVCTYSGGTPSKTVIVRFQTGQDTYDFASGKATLDSDRQTTTDVGGYGDEAYTSVLSGPGGITVTTLVARKGDVEVLISAPTALEPIGTLMQKILSQF
jgi:hypothetical protein